MTQPTRNENTFNFSWGSQQSHILDGLKTLAVGEISNVFLTDVTLACEGEYIDAHRLVLSLCSSFFKELFNQNERISDKAHGIVILSHVLARDLRYMLQFMYQGAVQVPQKDVDSFLESGRMLKVEGLMSATNVGVKPSPVVSTVPTASTSSLFSKSPVAKRGRGRPPSTKRRRTSGSGGGTNAEVGGYVEANVNVKIEQSSFPVVTTVNDDDTADQFDPGEVMMDDFGDAGGDSDFGGGALSGDEGTAPSFKPEPGTSQPENQKTVTHNRKHGVVGRRGDNDSSSSSSDDDDDDSSDSSSGSTENYLDSAPKPKQKLKLTYEFTKKFDTLAEAKAYVKAARRWRVRYVRMMSDNQRKHQYDCLQTRDCPARMYLLEWGASVDLYTSVAGHSHTERCRKNYGLPDDVKAKIKELYEKGMKKPQRLILALKAEGLQLEELKNTQIIGYINNNLRKKKN
ncbi:unnamed protein product [Orchesella dallaii]|uniref:BTB domain-containing protein n=1 Tax=Orchesella dallaii TaxID=48710 RepID=A0ABP1QLT1_9HEXA